MSTIIFFILFFTIWVTYVSSSSSSSFSFASSSSTITSYPSLGFLALGDWGGSGNAPYYTDPQVQVGIGMANIINGSYNNIQAILALGDNFYPLGLCNNETFFSCNVTNNTINTTDWRTGTEYDPRFNDTFEHVYTDPAYTLNNKIIYWHPLAGNHDALGNITAELFYSNHSKRWRYPYYYYTLQYSLIPYNTTTYIWKEVDKRPSNALLHVSFMMLDATLWYGIYPVEPEIGIEEWVWISTTLPMLAEVSDFLFVASHYPLYSACAHGNTDYMITNLLPLLDYYNITAYLSGHDHCQEYLTLPLPSKPEVLLPLIVTGTGDGCCYGASNVDYIAPAILEFLQAGESQYNPTNETGGFIKLMINK